MDWAFEAEFDDIAIVEQAPVLARFLGRDLAGGERRYEQAY
jgi:hypothetical protein